jgi:hypothetical protein
MRAVEGARQGRCDSASFIDKTSAERGTFFLGPYISSFWQWYSLPDFQYPSTGLHWVIGKPSAATPHGNAFPIFRATRSKPIPPPFPPHLADFSRTGAQRNCNVAASGGKA